VKRAALVVLALAAPAAAHDARSPLAVRVELAAATARVHVVYRLVGADAGQLFEQLDADASGDLDAAERTRLHAVLAPRVARSIGLGKLQLVEKTHVLDVTARAIELDLLLEAAYRAPVGESELLLAVEWPDPRAITPVVVRGLGLTVTPRAGEASRGAPLSLRITSSPRRARPAPTGRASR
jgi:hypothetical protein